MSLPQQKKNKEKAKVSQGINSKIKDVKKRDVPKKSSILPRTIKKSTISPYSKKLKRYAKLGAKSLLLSPLFHSAFKIIGMAAIVASMLYGSYSYISKTFANEVVVSQSEIVARVGKLVSLPGENPYEIVRVQDENDLRKQNPFYKDVKEGDYILMYKNLAVIYDLRNNVIVAIKRD
jgi:hypothetical protein